MARALGAAVLAVALLGAVLAGAEAAEVQVAAGLRVETVAVGLRRPVQLAFEESGRLVVLCHGLGDAAAEIVRLDPAAGPLPADGARVPRVVVPFTSWPRKTAFGSLAIDPGSGELLIGEENGHRIYRLTSDARLREFALGLNHLVGGGSIAMDGRRRLLVLDFASPETRLRSETPPPAALAWLAPEAYQGPILFRVDTARPRALPWRLDLLSPLFPSGWVSRVAHEPVPRFISVAATAAGEPLLFDSLGSLWRLTEDNDLALLAALPSGHYHRTSLAVAPDGGVFVSSGFHVRKLYHVSPRGAVTTVAWDLGDPEGIAVGPDGSVYVAETALHRVIRIAPVR